MSEMGIKELAESLGISTASVSRALSNPDRVSKKMRERVQAAAKAVGYRQNLIGASLRTSKTYSIIVIIPDISDTFVSGVIRSLERTAAEHGYSVLFGDTEGLRERELVYGDMVRSKKADGIICFSHRIPFDEDRFASGEIELPPMVNSCELMDDHYSFAKSVPWVAIDNVAAGRDATEHLISIGHKDIAVITGDMNTPSSQQRLQGYRNAMQSAGLDYKDSLIYDGSYTLEAGEHRTKDILASKERPTAIFCMCDEIALGCYSTLKENGFNVPDDMSVVGFDDIRFAKYFSPALTTIAQPVEDIGRHCVEVLLDQIKGTNQGNKQVLLPHKLIVRNSTKALNPGAIH